MKTKKWKPNVGETYYYIYIDSFPEVVKDTWDGELVDLMYYDFGNCYRTKTEANKKFKQIKIILKQP